MSQIIYALALSFLVVLIVVGVAVEIFGTQWVDKLWDRYGGHLDDE